jgi:hypothetical protein
VDSGREPDAVAGAFQGGMEAGEKAHAPWEHEGDAVEAAVEDLPGEEGTRMGLTRKGSEKFADLVVSLGREGGETAQGVYCPAEKLLAGGPVCVAQAQFLDQEVGRFVVAVVGVVGTKEEVEHVKDVSPGLAQVSGCALAEGQEIIDKCIDVGQRGVGWVWGRGLSERHGYWWGGEQALEGVRQGQAGDPPGVVDEVGRRLGVGAKVWCGLDKPHEERDVEAN